MAPATCRRRRRPVSYPLPLLPVLQVCDEYDNPNGCPVRAPRFTMVRLRLAA